MKKIVGINVGDYSFNAVSKQVTFIGISGLTLDQIIIITNVTDNILIYNFMDPVKGGSLVGSVLTLDYDTSGMGNSDNLQIYIWHTYNDSGAREVNIVDKSDNSKVVKVDDSGNLYTIIVPPETPAGKTQVTRISLGLVGGSTYLDDEYIIPSGETLVLQRFICSAEGDINKYSKALLYYAPSGSIDGTEEVLALSYLGDTFVTSLNEEYLGNGTKKIIMRRERMDAGEREMFARWVGYY